MKKQIISLILSAGLLLGLAVSVNASTFSGFDALTPEDSAVFTATTTFNLIIPPSTTVNLTVTTLAPITTSLTPTSTSTPILTITAMGNAEEYSGGIFLISGTSTLNAISPTTSTLFVTSSTIPTLSVTADVLPITPITSTLIIPPSTTTTLAVIANVGGGGMPTPIVVTTMASTPTTTNLIPQMTEVEIHAEIVRVSTLIVQLMQEWVKILASS
ncbi:MAG: hypothetical protein Q7R99_00660 [bacterium]|nr:hypothetical protein [bacterium]